MKKATSFLCRIMLMVLAFVTGASSGVFMANASELPDAGRTTAGADGTGGTDGIATETAGRTDGDSNFYLSDVDKRIVKIRPMATPIDQISRYAKSSSTNSFEVKYYSVGTREIKCSTNKKVEKMLNGASTSLPVDDLNMFTLDDTIRVVGVKAITKPDGTNTGWKTAMFPTLYYVYAVKIAQQTYQPCMLLTVTWTVRVSNQSLYRRFLQEQHLFVWVRLVVSWMYRQDASTISRCLKPSIVRTS